jgi:hypothetical protein
VEFENNGDDGFRRFDLLERVEKEEEIAMARDGNLRK